MKKAILFILAAGILKTSSAAAFEVRHDFNVSIGPFDAAVAQFTYTLNPSDYGVNSKVKTDNLFNTLYPFKANYATTGKIKKDKFETATYHYDSQSRFNKRSKELVYDDNGRPVYRLSTKNGKQKKGNVDTAIDSTDTTDLQTIFAKLAKQYNDVRFCDARMQVFDGKKRFDVIFKDEGKEELPAAENTPFSGQAAKCSIYIDKLGAKGDDLLWELTSDRPIYFWMMEDPQTHKPFIVKIIIEDTPLGRLEAYAQNVEIKD